MKMLDLLMCICSIHSAVLNATRSAVVIVCIYCLAVCYSAFPLICNHGPIKLAYVGCALCFLSLF